MSAAIAMARTATITRSLGMSTILGMGLSAETLEVDDRQLRYRGVEWHWIIWRLVRVDRTVHLRDVTGLSRSFGINPLLVVLASLALVNTLANLLGIDWFHDWWFHLPFWQLPFLGFVHHILGLITDKWLI